MNNSEKQADSEQRSCEACWETPDGYVGYETSRFCTITQGQMDLEDTVVRTQCERIDCGLIALSRG